MRGSALIITMLATATLTLLGLGFLAMAETESMISASGRNGEQLVHTAETGVRMVKAWFDQPVTGNPTVSTQVLHRFLDAFDLRNPALYDRTRRLLDHDNDPNTPRVAADGTSARPYYRQGRTLWAPSPYLDLFHKPYRGEMTTQFLGTADGPDLLIEEIPNVLDFLDILNQRLFTDQMQTGRISRIAIYAPPELPFDGVSRPSGIATVEVTATKFRRMTKVGIIPVVTNGSPKLGEVTLKIVLSEVPAAAANGPLESCGNLTATGPLQARWGKVIASGDVQLSSSMDSDLASAYPYKTFARRISGSAPGDDFYEWSLDPDDTVEDPWLKILTAGGIAGHSGGGSQPVPFDQANPVDGDHSNLFQEIAGVDCGRFDYDRFRTAAASGDEAARYFTWDATSGLFKEWGNGPARSVRDWTHNQEGLFFFDTKDGAEPNGHGPGDPQTNLTPPVAIQNSDWNFSGLLYLNAESVSIRNVIGVNRVVIPPGEPFDDVNSNGRHDTGETWVNLRYPTTVVSGNPGSEFVRDPGASQTANATSPDNEFYTYTTSTSWDPQGIPVTGQVSLFGVLYNAGEIVADGPARHYGSLVAGYAVVQAVPGSATAEVLFDQRLNNGTWPPAEISFPRTQLSSWFGPS